MSDTNDMRREFEAWCETFGAGMLTDQDDNAKLARLAAWSAWKTATERATAIERERCAKSM